MAPPSVYKYFRPFTIPLYLSGQFPVINILSHSADLLQFRVSSLPFISICVLEFFLSFYFVIYLAMSGVSFYRKVVSFIYFIFKYSMLQWTKWKSKLIIESLQEIDNLRQCPALIPYHITPRKPKYFLWIISAAFLSIPFVTSLYVFIYFSREHTVLDIFHYGFYTNYFANSHFRIMVLVSLILYFCSIAVGDLMRVWDVCVLGFLHAHKSLRDFCNLMGKETVITKKITTLLGAHFLIIILELYVRLLVNVFLDAEFDTAEWMNLFKLFQSVSLFWFMVSTINLPSTKFQELSYDIFTTELNQQDLTRRDAARIKTILLQVEDNPGEVNVAGYGSIDKKVILWYLYIAIEYLILLWQNKELIRELALKIG